MGKVQHKKKPVSNLESMQIVGFSQHLQNLLRFLFCKSNLFIIKKLVETISVTINGSSDVLFLTYMN